MIRKFLSWLLVLAMVCTMLPAQALAAATNKETTALETLYVARVNPLYADEITEADLNEPANVMPLSDPEYLSDPEEAGAYLREGMKVREETVAVGFLSDGFSQEIVDTLSEEFIDAALAHTGVPTEGDYLAWQYYGWKCTVSGSTDGTDYYLTFTYALTYYTDVEQEAAMDTAIADLLTDLNPSGTDYEKVKAVYDWICDNVTYDYDNLEDDTYRLKHTAYAALINRTAVCQGYAVLLYRLALEMGIDIRLIPGDSDGDGESDHAWNIVELGDLYYNADPTWDTNYAESDNYQYFLVTDDNFTSHTRDAEYATEAFYAAYPMGQTDYDPEADSGSDIAASGTCGESLTWVLTSDGILTISGEGAMYDYDMTEEQRAPWYEHRASITAIVVEDGVTYIGKCAFYGASAVSLTMADSVQSLGSYFCSYMGELTTVNLPEGITEIPEGAFYWSVKLCDVNIPSTVTVIGTGAFSLCVEITELELPSGLTAIGELALGYTQGLTSIILPDSLTEIGAQAFEGSGITEVTIPANVETIGDRAFGDCDNLTAIYVAEGGNFISVNGVLFDVDTLMQVPGAYQGEVEIFNYVTEIAPYALSGCQYVDEITLSARIAKVGDRAFNDCPALTQIHFQGDAPTFGENAFANTTATVDYPAANTFWTEEVMQQYGGTITWTPYGTDLVAYGVCGETDLNQNQLICGDNVTWTLTSDGTMTFSGTGRVMDCGLHGNHPWFKLCSNDPNRITSIVVEEGITYLGSFLFYVVEGVEHITSISLPSTLTEINGATFCGTSITELVLPENLVTIGNLSFSGSAKLEYVRIPAGVEVIGDNAFGNCTSLTAIDVDPENAAYYSDAGVLYSADHILMTLPGGFEGAYQVLDGTTSIADSAAKNAWKLTEITIPDSVQTIGSYAFSGCTALSSVDMGNGVTSFGGQQVFANCSSLTDVKLSESLTSLCSYTFYECDALNQIVIPASVAEMGDYAFWKSDNISEITFQGDAPTFQSNTFNSVNAGTAYYPADNATWTADVMQNYGGTITWVAYDPDVVAEGTCGENLTWVLSNNGTLTISGEGDMYDYENGSTPWGDHAGEITSVVIEEGVTSIGDYAFLFCSNISSVTIPEGVTDIGAYAFTYCVGLTAVDLPDSLVSLGDYALGQTGLTEITISAGVETIGLQALTCETLTAIYVDSGNTSFTSLDGILYTDQPFYNTIKLKQVPCAYTGEFVIPEHNNLIGDSAMRGCAFVTKVTIPAYTTEIGTYAFADCAALTEVYFCGDAVAIGEYAFSGDTVTAYYPSANTTWTEDVLQQYGGTVTWVPYGENLVAYGFCGENDLESEIAAEVICTDNATWSLTGDGTMTISGSGKMMDCHLGGNHPWIAICSNDATRLTRVVIEEGITYVGNFSFFDFIGENITSLSLPSTLTEIATGAFSGTAITELNLPENLEILGNGAFASCYNLTSVRIPASVTSVSSFNKCTGLTEVWFEGNAPTFADNTFGSVTATVYYPTGNSTWTSDVMQNYGGTLTWVAYGDEEPITITSQPVDFVGLVGDMATFTVVAEGEELSYQWYFSKDNGTTWETASSKTNSISLEFKAYRLGYMYRCEITDADGNTVVSDPATLRAEEVELVITSQPVSYVGAVNDEVSFTVEATGNGLVYEWVFSTDGGETWAKSYSPGYQTNTLAPILRAHRDGNMYKCIVTDVFDNIVESDAVSMSVKASDIVITSQPANVENAILGQLYTFTVEATGDNLTYRWEVSSDGGETWSESWNQGYNTVTLSVRMNANRDGNQYRCVITSGQKIVMTSDAAILDLQDPSVEIISQSGNVTVLTGATATFTVEAEGMDLTYLWYRSNDKGASWSQTYLTGYNTNTLSFAANTNRAAMYMCKVTDGSGTSVWSDPVKLQILSAELKILTQPVSVTCAAGETATFTVEAQGDTLTYQWYASSDGGETWTMSYLTGYNTAEFSFTVNAARAAKLYKCVITDVAGNTVETDAVSVTIG